MKIDPFMLRARPDQVSYSINELLFRLDEMNRSIKVTSDDRKTVIIIGEQPVNPNTGKPYSFGIHTYQIKGDRLEEI